MIKTMTFEDIAKNYAHIPGWGVDADRENEPTYPMKKYTGDDHRRINYRRPPQQPVDVEILKSNERPTVSAVFGASSPPSGLSGAVRRYAFRYSESSWAHWLPLIMADRINAVEGLIDDLKHGYIPNIFAERGWNAEWKYNRKGMMKKLLIGVTITAAAIVLLANRKKMLRNS
jgi:hypothetical protein